MRLEKKIGSIFTGKKTRIHEKKFLLLIKVRLYSFASMNSENFPGNISEYLSS